MVKGSPKAWKWGEKLLSDEPSSENDDSKSHEKAVSSTTGSGSTTTVGISSSSSTATSPIITPVTTPKHDWLATYYQKLSYTTSAIKQVKNRTALIANHIKSTVDKLSNSKVWGEGRTRRGLVIGSVQSGKTASMLGVIASSLDGGTDIIVLLSGTKISLMQQTVDRMYNDLIPSKHTKYAYVLPKHNDANVTSEKIGWSPSMNSARRQKYIQEITESLVKGRKIILGVMKQKDHLITVSKIIEEAISNFTEENDKKLHMLVVDDESDDASILDTEDSKSTPIRICRLWSGTKSSINYHHTHNERLFATYIGYTATPQANILQDHENPLYPENFIFSLKTPHFEPIIGDDASYVETDGIKATYTGGEIFYNTEFSDRDASITCTEFTSQDRIDLAGPLRAFLVGAAVHLLDQNKLPPSQSNRYPSFADADHDYVEPFTMVFHPSAKKGEHFNGRDSLIDWINLGPQNKDVEDGDEVLQEENMNSEPAETSDDPSSTSQQILREENINPELLRLHLETHSKDWEEWITRFNKSSQEWNTISRTSSFRNITYSWSEIKEAIFEKVLPSLNIRVLNSDVNADDKPKFKPWRNPDNPNEFMPQTDCISIFVAGNVLGRGLTIEGLRITAFERSSTTPAQDTQMQMQRWFGYRGKYLPQIRLFLSETQLEHFTAYHQADVVVKNIVLSKESTIDIERRINFQPDILTTATTVPTLKTNTSRRPIHPGKFPSFMLFNESEGDKKHNLSVFFDLIEANQFDNLLNGAHKKIGIMNKVKLSSSTVAEFLESLQFTNHKPGPLHPDYKRWEMYNTNYNLNFNPNTLCKTFGGDFGEIGEITTNNSPYSIAAYLKLWLYSTTLNRSFTYAPDDKIWDGSVGAPEFNLVVLNGDSKRVEKIQDSTKSTFNLNLSKRAPDSNFWGNSTGSANRYDDKLVDYHISGAPPAPMTSHGGGKFQGDPTPRLIQNGNPGLLVIRLIDVDGSPSLAVGFNMPVDGPAHLRANN